MPVLVRRRALVVAADPERRALEGLFASGRLEGWDAVTVDGLDRARFVLQLEPCDALVLDAGLYPVNDAAALDWLGGPEQTPVLFLADPVPGLAADALRHGAVQWLPRDLALAHPPLLEATLGTAAHVGDLRRRARRPGEALEDCRRQVSRLVGLLWEAGPTEGPAGWFTQRHMLERLDDEVSLVQRHGGPLTVVLGEVQGGRRERLSAGESHQLAEWTAQRVVRAKRRGDVAGRYGPHGFMLLLPRTSDVGADGCCRRLRDVLEEPPAVEEAPLPSLHACFGVAAFSPETTAKGLLRQAEERLERAKEGSGVYQSTCEASQE
jgi:diguanylate cyclase (GGDEF)-like protein